MRTLRGTALASARAALKDAVSSWLTPHGFEAEPDSVAHVSYLGSWEGRSLNVQASVRTVAGGSSRRSRRRVAGLHLDVVVDTDLRTRMVSLRPDRPFAGLARRVLRFRGYCLVTDVPTGADGVEFWAVAPEWARVFLCDSNVVAALDFAGALSADSSLVMRLGPGKLSLSTSVTLAELHAPVAEAWLSAAVKLVRLGEALSPPPSVELTWLEKQQEENPRRAALILALLLVLGLPAALLIGTATILGSIYLLFGADGVAKSLIAFAAVLMPIAMTAALIRFVRRLRPRAPSRRSD